MNLKIPIKIIVDLNFISQNGHSKTIIFNLNTLLFQKIIIEGSDRLHIIFVAVDLELSRVLLELNVNTVDSGFHNMCTSGIGGTVLSQNNFKFTINAIHGDQVTAQIVVKVKIVVSIDLF